MQGYFAAGWKSEAYAIHLTASIPLPPQDFDLTVGIVAAILYMPLFVFLIGVVLLLWGVMQSILGAITSGLSALFERLVPSYGSSTSGGNKIRAWLQDRVEVGRRIVNLGFGNIFLSVLLFVPYFFVLDLLVSQNSLVKWIAYASDFQPAAKYPCIEKHQRIRLHENGVISTASHIGLKVNIQTHVLVDVANCEFMDK